MKKIIYEGWLLALLVLVAVFGQSFFGYEGRTISPYWNILSVSYLCFTVINTIRRK